MSIGSYTQNSQQHRDKLAQIFEHLAKKQIDLSKLIDFERQQTLLKAVQKIKPENVSISYAGKKLILQFKLADNRFKRNLPDRFNDDGIVNALVKAELTSKALTYYDNTQEFWAWFDAEILEQKEVRDNVITIAKAIETVKTNFFSGKDKCGRDRNNVDLLINSIATYNATYGKFYKKMPSSLLEKHCKAKYLIAYLDENWGHLLKKKSSTFINAKNAIRKLLIDSKLLIELQEFELNYGKIQTVQQREDQSFDLGEFIAFRERVLGLNGNKLNGYQKRSLSSRKSWFKAICFNLVYGFRCGEFNAIANLDKPYFYDGEWFKALTDPTNDRMTVILKDRYTITCNDGTKHSITIKTADRQARPLLEPRYYYLINEFGILDNSIEFPEVICEASSEPDTVKQAYSRRVNQRLRDWGKAHNYNVTQTHAMRHYANYTGKLMGLTEEQRSITLGHGENMNRVYNRHISAKAKNNLLYAEISPGANELAEVKAENKLLKEQLEFLKRENANLKRLLSNSDNIIQFPDTI